MRRLIPRRWEHDRLSAVEDPVGEEEEDPPAEEGRMARGPVVCDAEEVDAARPKASAHSYRRYVCCITMIAKRAAATTEAATASSSSGSGAARFAVC